MSAEIQNGSAGQTEDSKKLCRRCGAQNSAHLVRQEILCQDCFGKYISKKVIKRVEAFRGRRSDPTIPRKWLLPISLGQSSMSLLHVLNDNMQRQINKTGQTDYELYCLHVVTAETSEDESSAAIFKEVQDRYPEHAYTTVPLITTSELESETALPLANGDFVCSPDSESHPLFTLQSQLSLSSRADLSDIMLHKTIIRAAQKLECEGVLLGDCTTRLAEKVLAETAKGRGFALPSIVNDHQTSPGVWVFYPMRDLLKKEVVEFAQSLALPTKDSLRSSAAKSNVPSIKNSTIDSLMMGYFQSVEETYPSIVANVVRTSSKLQQPLTSGATANCALCERPMGRSNSRNSDLVSHTNDSNSFSVAEMSDALCGGCAQLAIDS